MDDYLNLTYITLAGHVEVQTYKYLYFFILLLIYILILCCNLTITCLIWLHRDLHEPMYIFIAALLVNSAIFSTAIYPKMLIDFLSEKQIISYPACLFQFFMFYAFGGAEFLLLAAMAYDRYVSICKPLQYPTIMRKSTVILFLVFSWFIPFCQIAVQVLLSADLKLCSLRMKGIFCTNSIYDLHCVPSPARSIFGLFALLSITSMPVLFILFTYSKILCVAYQSCGEVRKKAAQTCLPHLLVLVSISFLSAYDVTIARLGSDFPDIVHLFMTLQIIIYHPLFNPIIYGLKMKEISKHLKTLFYPAKAIEHNKSDVNL